MDDEEEAIFNKIRMERMAELKAKQSKGKVPYFCKLSFSYLKI